MLAAVGGAAAQMAKTDRTLPPFQDRLHLGLHLKALGLKTGVELGVRTGDFAAALLHIWPASRYMLVDAWRQLYSGQYSRELPSAYMRTMIRPYAARIVRRRSNLPWQAFAAEHRSRFVATGRTCVLSYLRTTLLISYTSMRSTTTRAPCAISRCGGRSFEQVA